MGRGPAHRPPAHQRPGRDRGGEARLPRGVVPPLPRARRRVLRVGGSGRRPRTLARFPARPGADGGRHALGAMAGAGRRAAFGLARPVPAGRCGRELDARQPRERTPTYARSTTARRRFSPWCVRLMALRGNGSQGERSRSTPPRTTCWRCMPSARASTAHATTTPRASCRWRRRSAGARRTDTLVSMCGCRAEPRPAKGCRARRRYRALLRFRMSR